MIALFFDTETTGFKTFNYTPRLVQLGAILQDIESGKILAEFNGMVKTEGFPIPKQASDVHGIDNKIADTFGFSMLAVDRVFGRMVSYADIVVAHNIKFDLGIISDNLPISDEFISDKQKFCTMQNTINILKLPGKYPGNGYKWPKLMESYKHYFGQEFDNAHDAMADVRACRDIYIKLNEDK